MYSPSDDAWTEYNDFEMARWKITRAVIEHENTLTNHRLTWLFSSQAFLFAAFALVFQSSLKQGELRDGIQHQVSVVLGGISALGFTICIYLYWGIKAAQSHLDRVDNWYHGETDLVRLERSPVMNEPDRSKTRVEREKRCPPLQGTARGDWTDYFHNKYIPIMFMLVWTCLLAFVVFDGGRMYETWVKNNLLLIVLFVLVGVLCFGLGRASYRKQ
jgi:hypothetical protein